MGNNWKYLEHPVFAYRSLVAAEYLRDCDAIVEIGGFVNPIVKFTQPYQSVTIIDKFPAEYDTSQYRKLNYIQGYFEDVDFSFLEEEKYGLVFLGFHFEEQRDDTMRLFKELFYGAHKAVLECPVGFHPSFVSLDVVHDGHTWKEQQTVLMDFTDNNMTGYDHLFPPFLKRKMYLIQP